MTRKFYCLIFMLASSLQTLALDKMTVRKIFYSASQNKAQTEALHRYLALNGDNSSLTVGYTSMYYMLMARYAFNPLSKLNLFNKGRKMLDAAVEGDKANTELRFLRFSVQVNAPSFLSYNSNLDEDKQHIITAYSKLDDADLKFRIKEFMSGLKIKLD